MRSEPIALRAFKKDNLIIVSASPSPKWATVYTQVIESSHSSMNRPPTPQFWGAFRIEAPQNWGVGGLTKPETRPVSTCVYTVTLLRMVVEAEVNTIFLKVVTSIF